MSSPKSSIKSPTKYSTRRVRTHAANKRDKLAASLPSAYARQLLIEIGHDPTDAAAIALTESVIRELGASGTSATMDQMYEVDFIRKPPTIEEFMMDEYFMGTALNPDPVNDAPGLFDKWREVLIRDMAPGSPVKQLVLSGAIGQGKSWVASIALLYKVAFALCLRDPMRYYGLSGGGIVYSFFSVTQKQVFGGTFQDCLRFLRASPFFREHVRTKLDQKFTDRRIVLTNDLSIEAGSQISDALGRNVLVSAIDEINFRREKDASQGAHELVEAVIRRILSRYRNGVEANDHPGLLILMSSAQDSGDFLAQYVKEHRHDPSVAIYDFPWWEVTGPHRINYSGKKFYVDIGDAVISPRIVDVPAEVAGVPPDRLLEVPVEHRQEFTSDISGSIKDLAGVATGRSSLLFTNTVSLINCLDDEIEDPMNGHSVPLGVNVNEQPIWDHINMRRLLKWKDSRAVPLRHPYAPRYIHMDMSTGAEDAMGFAMVHPVRQTMIETRDQMTHRSKQAMRQVVELDMAFRIIRDPKKPSEPIDFGRIREFIWWLKTHNYNISMVSCDLMALSQEMRMILKNNGINTSYLSCDKTKDPYKSLRQCVNEGRFRMFEHDYLMLELEHLEDMPDKIDHPAKFKVAHINGQVHYGLKGSKDICDAVTGAVYMAQQSDYVGSGSDPDERAAALNSITASKGEAPESWLFRDAPKDRIRTM